jgi:hypothetical protein
MRFHDSSFSGERNIASVVCTPRARNGKAFRVKDLCRVAGWRRASNRIRCTNRGRETPGARTLLGRMAVARRPEQAAGFAGPSA